MSRLIRSFVAASILFVNMTVWATEQDSLIIDHRVISIDAQVQFDSIIKIRTKRTDAWMISDIEAGLFWGAGGRNESDRWHQWTGRYDGAIEVRSTIWKTHKPRDFRKAFSFDWSAMVGLNVAWLQSVNTHLLSDSVIGFLPASEVGELQQVTYERFAIGVETDTLDVPVEFQRAFAPFAMVRFSARTDRFIASLGLGLAAASKRESRIQFRSPELDAMPFIDGAWGQSIWQPRITWSLGWQFPASRWAICATGLVVPMSEQNHFIGLKIVHSLTRE